MDTSAGQGCSRSASADTRDHRTRIAARPPPRTLVGRQPADRILELRPALRRRQAPSAAVEATEGAIKIGAEDHRQSGTGGTLQDPSHYRYTEGRARAGRGVGGLPLERPPVRARGAGLRPPPYSRPDGIRFTPGADHVTAARLHLELAPRELVSSSRGPSPSRRSSSSRCDVRRGRPCRRTVPAGAPRLLTVRDPADLRRDHHRLRPDRRLVRRRAVGVWPDIICFGKGMTGGYSPLSGVLMAERSPPSSGASPRRSSSPSAGHTHGGNPVACAAGPSLRSTTSCVMALIGQAIENVPTCERSSRACANAIRASGWPAAGCLGPRR